MSSDERQDRFGIQATPEPTELRIVSFVEPDTEKASLARYKSSHAFLACHPRWHRRTLLRVRAGASTVAMGLFISHHSYLQGFQRVSDNIGNDAPATRDRFEAIVKACAKSASLDSSFQESEIAAANGHSSSCPEARVRIVARSAYSLCMPRRPITVQALCTVLFLDIQ